MKLYVNDTVVRFVSIIRDNYVIITITPPFFIDTLHNGLHSENSKETKDNLQSFLFFVYISSVICTLFIYCFIGECFIQESSNFGNAIYNYDWYNLPVTESKFFLICMIRSKKPQFLTSGKFAVLSLSIFTDILKTSMGYLSVLRTFL
ncbi:odorant receptor 22c-like [Vespa mandarinia]|uniref:odorant receptor 22c-like n=1 Tax=Vespa mandarinia TaxID=7446 RepID=UPI00161611A5|nr:odorant receptor 22c-like [Vespa mandarinia]